MNPRDLPLALIAAVFLVSAAGAQIPEFPTGEPRDLAEAQALLQKKEARLDSLKSELADWEKRPQQIKDLDKIHKGYRTRIDKKYNTFETAHKAYIEFVRLHENSCVTGDWTAEAANVSMDKRKREGGYWIDKYGPWRSDIETAGTNLKTARDAYYTEKDKIDKQVNENPDVYFPEHTITTYAEFTAAIKEISLEYKKEGVKRIAELKGTHRGNFKDGEIYRLQKEIELLRDYVYEWRDTGRRPGSTPPSPPAPTPPIPTPPVPTPPPPVAGRTQPDLVSQIVDVTPSGPIGSAPNRRCVWRFYIQIEEKAGRGVELSFANLAIEPSRQDDTAKRYHNTPSHRYAWRRGEIDHVGGWIDKTTEQWRHGDELPPAQRAPHMQEAVPARLALGPYYLMVWEDEGFVGKYEATFAATQRDGSGVSTTVTFTPPQPPWIAATALRIMGPDADDLIGAASCPENGITGHDQYHLGFGVVAPDLPPGLHRLELAFDPGPSRYIWARVPAGETGAQFGDRIPIPLGRYTVTLSVPESPHIAPITLNGRCDPARDTVEYLNKALAVLNAGNFKTDRLRGDALVDVADRQNYAGQWADALNAATQAVQLLPEYSESTPSGTSWGSDGRYYRDRAVQAQATAAYHLGDAEKFLSLMRWLWEYEARLGQMPRSKSSYLCAGEHAHFTARRLLRMGVHPDQVKPLIEQGDKYYRMGGSKYPHKTEWFPD